MKNGMMDDFIRVNIDSAINARDEFWSKLKSVCREFLFLNCPQSNCYRVVHVTVNAETK